MVLLAPPVRIKVELSELKAAPALLLTQLPLRKTLEGLASVEKVPPALIIKSLLKVMFCALTSIIPLTVVVPSTTRVRFTSRGLSTSKAPPIAAVVPAANEVRAPPVLLIRTVAGRFTLPPEITLGVPAEKVTETLRLSALNVPSRVRLPPILRWVAAPSRPSVATAGTETFPLMVRVPLTFDNWPVALFTVRLPATKDPPAGLTSAFPRSRVRLLAVTAAFTTTVWSLLNLPRVRL